MERKVTAREKEFIFWSSWADPQIGLNQTKAQILFTLTHCKTSHFTCNPAVVRPFDSIVLHDIFKRVRVFGKKELK